MEFHSNKDIEMWEWREEDFCLQKDSELDAPNCLWNDMNQNNNNSYSCGEQAHTPIKGCGNFGYDWQLEDKTSKMPESRESSQFKRRRMLQFTSDANDTIISNEQISFASENCKESDNSSLADEFLKCFEWNPEWSSSFSDDKCTFGNEGLDQYSEGWLANCLTDTEMHQSSGETSSEGWLANCLTNSEMHQSSGETSSCLNSSVTSDDHVEFSEPINKSSEVESVNVPEKPRSAICRIFRGRKSSMNTPTKLTTAVAYPFTLVKPCENQGDVTLKDINQRIHAPLLSRSKQKKDEGPSHVYPTSAYSGKPVVAKTKIRTVGGKGSITITRTKG